MNQSVCDDCTTVLDILNTFNGVFIFNYQHIHSCVMYLTKSRHFYSTYVFILSETCLFVLLLVSLTL